MSRKGLIAPLRFGAHEIQAGGAEPRHRFTLLVERKLGSVLEAGGPDRIRTCDFCLRRAVFIPDKPCQISYLIRDPNALICHLPTVIASVTL